MGSLLTDSHSHSPMQSLQHRLGMGLGDAEEGAGGKRNIEHRTPNIEHRSEEGGLLIVEFGFLMGKRWQ